MCSGNCSSARDGCCSHVAHMHGLRCHTRIHYRYAIKLSRTRCQDQIHTSAMGWLRLVGSFKLQVSSAKEPYKRDCILQKRCLICRSLLIVATLWYQDEIFMLISTWNFKDVSFPTVHDLHTFPAFPASNCHPLIAYGVATIRRLLKMVGLFCRISSLL